jgi:hypothetical protein
VKRATPKFDYGTSPWDDRGYELYIEKRHPDKDGWVLVKYVSGYTSLVKHVPSTHESILQGTLSECKAELQKIVEELHFTK